MTNQPSPLPGNIRRSKIGRLPTEIRHLLNQWIRDSIPYETISDRLLKLGHPGISPQNISTWSNGGHLLWLRDQEAADQLRENANRLTDILAEMEGDTADKCARLAEQMAAIQIAQMLQAVDPKTGKMLLQENQDLFFRLVRTLTHQTRERTFGKKIELEQRKYNDQVAKARKLDRKALEQAEQSKRGGVTQEELDMITGAMNILTLPPEQLARTVNKYRLLQYRIKKEAEERARRNDWENTEVSPDPYVAAIERGEDPFAVYGPPLPFDFCYQIVTPSPSNPGRDNRACQSEVPPSPSSEISNMKSEIAPVDDHAASSIPLSSFGEESRREEASKPNSPAASSIPPSSSSEILNMKSEIVPADDHAAPSIPSSSFGGESRRDEANVPIKNNDDQDERPWNWNELSEEQLLAYRDQKRKENLTASSVYESPPSLR